MSDDSATPKKNKAILELLDDPSPQVRRELLRAIENMGPAGIALLQSATRSSNRLLSWHARAFLAELETANPIEEFRDFIRSMNYELETGWILLSRVAYPDLDVGSVCRQLDEIALRCRELIVQPASSKEQCLVINRILFHEMGFRGNAEYYENPDNSFIGTILETKKGLPLALSILYILIAQRLGLDLEPVAIPGHFLVGCFEEDGPFYIDSFERGRFLKPGQLEQRIQESNHDPRLSYLAPASVRETLTRCCRNLAYHFMRSGQPQMANLYQSFLEDFKEAFQKRAAG